MPHLNKTRSWYWGLSALFALVSIVLPAHAQLQIGDNIKMNGSGSISVGYAGGLNETGGPGQDFNSSSHSMDVGGNATIHGSYFDPRFLSFSVSPFYDRSQSNSDSQSISDSSGYVAQADIFSGSRTPGYVNFSKTYNSSGTYGIPGLEGLTTHGNDRTFGIGWSALFPGLPTLQATLGNSVGESSLYGSSGSSHFGSTSLALNSGYTWRGFDLSAGYGHGWGNSNSHMLFLDELTQQESSTSSDNFNFGANHRIPLEGMSSIQYRHSSYSYDYVSQDQHSDGSMNDVSMFANIRPISRISLAGSAEYTSNLAGGLERQILDATGTLVRMNYRASSGLRYGATAYANIFKGLNGNAYVSHAEQSIAGNTYSATQYGAGATYSFAHSLLNGLNFNGGLVDTATQAGNVGLGFVGNVNYSRNMLGWMMNGSYSYSQNVQTLLVIYTRSSMSYSVSARKKLPRGRFLMAGFSGGHSGITGQAGTLSHNENYYTQLNTRRFSLSGTYAHSYGQTVQTATGLISLPTQLPSDLISPEDIVYFSGSSYSAGGSTTLFRRLSLSANYSHGLSDSHSLLNEISAFNSRGYFRFHYRLRKITIDGGYSRLWQDTHNQLTTHSVINSYFIGISRWFNFF